MSIIDLAIDRTRTVLLTLALILIAGTVAYSSIPKEASPDINIPYVFVTVTHRGISPEDAERLLIRPLEKELRTVEGTKEMTATAFEGGAQVVLEFEAGFNADQALIDVRQQVDIAKPELPADSDEPAVDEMNFSLFPILLVTLTGDVPERTLLKFARNLQDEIEGIGAVLEAEIAGDRDEQVDVIIDPATVDSYKLSALEIARELGRSNTLVAAGALDTGKGRFSIKVPGLLETVKDVMNLPVRVNQDAVVTLSDIATGRRTFEDPEGFARVNGKRALALEVSKRTGENIIETVQAVKAVVEQQQKTWPKTVNVSYSQDRSKDILRMLNDLQNSVITAVLLVMVVIVAALGLRTGLLVGVAIPGSFLMAILCLYAMGYTINTVVLFALILAVGMLVDGAVVVTEFADRKMGEGIHRKEAYATAAKRMAMPVIASTLTTLAAFMPLAFWTGVVGEFMKYLPITLVMTLVASLLMALIFVPTLGGLFGKPGSSDPKVMKALAASEKGDVMDIEGFTGTYARILNAALQQPGKILLACFGMLIAVQVLYGAFGKGVEFFPDIEPEQALVNVHARGNLSIMEKDKLVKEVEQRILGIEDFDNVYARTGQGGAEASEDVIGVVTLEFKEWDERRKARVVLAEVRERTSDLAGIEIEIREQEEGPSSGKPIQVELSATNYEMLPNAVAHVRKGLEEIGGFIDIEDSRPLPGIEWEIEVDRAQGAKFGVDVTSVGNMVQMVTRGLKFTDYRPDNTEDEIDIVARYPEKYRSLTQINNLRVNTAAGSVPISSFVNVNAKPKVSNIHRTDGKRVMTVKADVEQGILPDTKVRALAQWLTNNPLSEGVEYRFRGEDEERRKSEAFLVNAFGIALFVMAIILVTQFNSFYSAFLILSAVIMSTIGVMMGLLITGQPFGIIMSGIGVISLAGIVVNNNIVLIDTYDILKKQFNAHEAVLRTGVQRLRPVLLTTITTILGLLPMMLSLNIDFIHRDVSMGAPSMQWWVQLSTAVVSGLTFATVLTLIVTPCALKFWANFIEWLNNKYDWNITY